MDHERAFNLQSTEESNDSGESGGDNGLILNEIFIPIELIQPIFCHVDEKTLLNCQLVCKRWNEIITNYVWRKKAEIKTGHRFSSNTVLEWKDFYLICVKNLFGRNLLKNPSGADGLKYWKFVTDHFFVHENEQEFLSDNSYDSNSSDENMNESSDDNISVSSDDISDNETVRHSVSSIESDAIDVVVVVDENSDNQNNNDSDSDIEQEINEPFSSSSSDINTNSDNDSVGNNDIEDIDDFDVYDDSAHNWIIECPPVGAPLPPTEPEEDKAHCFVTTYFNCYKEQVIDLFKEGFSANILDQMQPTIEINEWYCSREDCPALYKLRVLLLNQFDKILEEFSFKDILEGRRQNIWFNVKHEFKNYGKGLRKIRFVNGGRDQTYWAGHYGSKMAGAYVKVKVSGQS